jgi:prevent-host-death family protein
MPTLAISKFKATCLAVLQRVNRTGRPVLITRFGKPVAQVVPPARTASGSAWIGSMEGRAEETGDLVAPALPPRSWAALRSR